MPKLLDVIKEKGLTHDQVIDILNNIDSEISETEEGTEEETESIQPEVEEEDTVIEESREEETQELINISKDELAEMISKAIEDKLKARRKPPSKGVQVEVPVSEKNVVKKNWFEVMV